MVHTVMGVALTVMLTACGDTGRNGNGGNGKDPGGNGSVPPAVTETTVDFSDSGLHDLDIKRGYILRDAVNRLSNDVIDDLRAYRDMGMQLVALPKDLNQFDANWQTNPHGEYFLSYRSLGSNYFGGDGEKEEFSRNGDGGIDVRVNSKYLTLCRTARDEGLQLVLQCSGVPVEGFDDGSVEHLFPLDDRRTFHEQARYYPLPAPGNYEANGAVIFEWMKKLHDELGVSNTIYAGNQEPSHTTGYFNGTITEVASIQNLQVYPAIWKPTALKLREAGMLGAVSQLNEVHAHYDPSLASITEKEVPLDYYSIQNYRAWRNSVILASARAALEKYGVPTQKKILFDRYDYGQAPGFAGSDERFGTAPGVVVFLDAELVLCDNADMVYGYCFYTGAQNFEMMNGVFTFLNAMPRPRKKIVNLPQGLKYMASADADKVSVAVWNPGTENITFDLGAPGATGTATLSILKGSGDELAGYTPGGWDPALKKMSKLSLGGGEFMLIEVNL